MSECIRSARDTDKKNHKSSSASLIASFILWLKCLPTFFLRNYHDIKQNVQHAGENSDKKGRREWPVAKVRLVFHSLWADEERAARIKMGMMLDANFVLQARKKSGRLEQMKLKKRSQKLSTRPDTPIISYPRAAGGAKKKKGDITSEEKEGLGGGTKSQAVLVGPTSV